MLHGLVSEGVSRPEAARVASLPPVSTLFAAFLGYNPMGVLLGPALHQLSAAHAAQLTSRSYFPGLIATPFHAGLEKAFDFAAVACLVAAVASWLSGGKYIHGAAEAESRESVESVEAMGASLVPLEEDGDAGDETDGAEPTRHSGSAKVSR
jgi:hypothetical protein